MGNSGSDEGGQAATVVLGGSDSFRTIAVLKH